MHDEEAFVIDGCRVAIIGSRDWGVWYDESDGYHQDLSAVKEFVGSLPPDCVIISGGARGVDTAAIEAAIEYGFEYKVWKADWNRYGKKAGYIRNLEVIRDSDIIIAFWDGYSKGTGHVITQAELQGKRYIIITP